MPPAVVNPRVVGSFRASGGSGNDIQPLLAEWSECENWINGHEARALYSRPKTTNGRFDVKIPEPGTYCIAFNNRFSLLSAKNVSADIELSYLIPYSQHFLIEG